MQLGLGLGSAFAILLEFFMFNMREGSERSTVGLVLVN